MSNIFSILKPAPYIEEIQDKEKVSSLYHYWRLRVLYSMFIGYALYYFTRKSFTFAMPGLIAELGFEKSQLGLLASIFSITYGVSKFASGIISDQSNPRYFMAIGLILTGVLNIAFGFSSSLFFLSLFWGLNGWFQGFGWPACARFLTHWYSHSERGSWWSSWNVSHNVGAFMIPWIAGACLHYFGWRYAMYVPGFICILGGFFLINRLRDTPQSLGLPPVEVFRNDYDHTSVSDEEKALSTKEILAEYIFKNKYLWMLGLAYFFVYIVRTGVNDWTALFLRDVKGYTIIGANGCASMFEVGGFFGSLAAGWGSDRLFKAKRGPINVLFSLGAVFAIIAFWYVPKGFPLIDSATVFLIGFTVFGPQMMIGIAAAELSHKNAASTSTGFVGTFAYLGAAVSGYPLGKVADDWGWNGVFYFMAICCLISVILLLPMWGVTEKKKSTKKGKTQMAT